VRNQATMLDVTKRHTLGWKGDEGERAGGRSHDEVQPRLADALGDADDALLLAAADRLHHEPDHRVGDAVGERLRDRMSELAPEEVAKVKVRRDEPWSPLRDPRRNQ
jgi:hypothetical protein